MVCDLYLCEGENAGKFKVQRPVAEAVRLRCRGQWQRQLDLRCRGQWQRQLYYGFKVQRPMAEAIRLKCRGQWQNQID